MIKFQIKIWEKPDMKESEVIRKIGNKQPFTVPENYFENFSVCMDAKLKSTSVPVFRQTRTWMYMAAAVVGAALLVQPIVSAIQKNKETQLVYKQLDVFVEPELEEEQLLSFFLDLL